MKQIIKFILIGDSLSRLYNLKYTFMSKNKFRNILSKIHVIFIN